MSRRARARALVLCILVTSGCRSASAPDSAAAPPRPAPGGGDAPLPAPAIPGPTERLPDVEAVTGFVEGGPASHPSLAEGDRLFDAQNFKESRAAYEKALEAGLGRDAAWHASTQLVLCALRLDLPEEALEAARRTVGRFLGSIDEARAWRVLGNLYLALPHWGTEQGGKLRRGQSGQGIYRTTYRPDRRMAVLALERARELFEKLDAAPDATSAPGAELHAERLECLFDLVTAVVSYGPYDATWGEWWWGWVPFEGEVDEELQASGRYARHSEGGAFPGEAGWPRGLPLDAAGAPIFDRDPGSYDAGLPPGEKMKALLGEIEQLDRSPGRDVAARARIRRAALAKNRYGNERLQQWSWFWYEGKRPFQTALESFELHQLKDDEALTLLGRRLDVVKLPPDEDVLGLLGSVAKDFPASSLRAEARYAAGVYRQSRDQLREAVGIFESLERELPGHERARSARAQIDALRRPEATLESVPVQLAGEPAKLKLAHRNTTSVALTARRIDLARYVREIWDDVATDDERKRYRSPDNVAYELLHQDDGGKPRYMAYAMGDPVSFELPVTDDGTHRLRRSELAAPAELWSRPGCWVVEAGVASQSPSSRVLLPVQDLALVEKHAKGGLLFLAANAATGEPAAGAKVRLLRYWTEWESRPNGQSVPRHGHEIVERVTDGSGLALFEPPAPGRYAQTMAMVALGEERVAFSGMGYLSTYVPSSRREGVRALVFTDRPVYRPGQVVHVKAFLRTLAAGVYEPAAAQKGLPFTVLDARNQKLAEGRFDLDDMGGGAFDVTLPGKEKEPPLGLYTIHVGASVTGGQMFRVEEYRKPEMEVTVAAGKELARLGERVTATIEARYLFGAPAAGVGVTYRVMRDAFVPRNAEPGPWDWLYGAGYGLSPYAYEWYPWWGRMGCKVAWWPGPAMAAPEGELVLEGSGVLSAEGKLEVAVDTAPALRDHPDEDHRYRVLAEVRDASRRVYGGEGQVVVTRQPFEAFVEVDRGYYRTGEQIVVKLRTATATGTPVAAKGKLTMSRVRFGDADAGALDAPSDVREVATDADGRARVELRAPAEGQVVLRMEAAAPGGKSVEGAAVVWVWGPGFEGQRYRMNDLEVLTDRRTYAPGDTARVLLQSDRENAWVLFSPRSDSGYLLEHRLVRLKGKSLELEVPVGKGDVPNFFVEATTVFGGEVHQEAREVLVPPQDALLDVEVVADRAEVRPGQEARITVRTRRPDGTPVRAQVALAVFDRGVLQIQPELTPDARSFFWGERRRHDPQARSSLQMNLQAYGSPSDPRGIRSGGNPMDWDGGFGDRTLSLAKSKRGDVLDQLGATGSGDKRSRSEVASSEPLRRAEAKERDNGAVGYRPASPQAGKDAAKEDAKGGEEGALVAATVRKAFADTAAWVAAVDTTDAGEATVPVTFPENLTTWKCKAIGLTRATQAGQADTSVVTTKKLLVRLASPRFFTERDEVVLSANVHNYLAGPKRAKVTLAVPAELMTLDGPASASVDVPAGGEARVDFKVKVAHEGLATIRIEALTDEESDAAEMAFPVLVHGFSKTVARTGAIDAGSRSRSVVQLEVPAERRPGESVLHVRVSPSLALAMLDALPYLVEYPYGCTEQTMSRFVPAVLTRRTLQRMGLSLEELAKARTNLDAQQRGPGRFGLPEDPSRKPVYSSAELDEVVAMGLRRIADMQRPDGGWGWWHDDTPSTYLTAYVVWGLLEAQAADVPVDAGMLQRGLQALQGGVARDIEGWKDSDSTSNTQAFIAHVLASAPDKGGDQKLLGELLDLAFERRIHLSLYGKALLSLALRGAGDAARADLVLQNARQKEERDDENGTVSYPTETEGSWYWWHNDVESQAWVLRAIVAKAPGDPAAPGLVKWLLHNRRNGSYWRSTRDTAIVLAAFSDYLEATAEAEPDMTVNVLWDGKPLRSIRIQKSNLASFDNVVTLTGEELVTGSHELVVERTGRGPVYWNAELSYFTMEEGAKAAGLEVKVARAYHRLVRDDRTAVVPGGRLEPVPEHQLRYRRELLADGDSVVSGELVEVDLRVTSKNDYDYLLFEDPKPAGFEPVEVRSGARFGELVSNLELRDEKVAFFVGWLSRGEHVIRYRLRAEAPGRFHALPTRALAMYAPEIRANADEAILGVADR